MCMIDGAERCTVLANYDPVARREHRCAECGRVIAVGETYHRERLLFEGTIEAHKTCRHCMIARQWLSDECGGWLYGGVEEDLREHTTNCYGAYPMSVLRLAVGMQWQWRRPSGAMLPVPAVPPTTREIMAARAA